MFCSSWVAKSRTWLSDWTEVNWTELNCVHLCLKWSLGISNFLEVISSLPHSIVFLYFFALIPEEDFLISPCHSFELWIQMNISFLLFFAFHYFSFLSYYVSPSFFLFLICFSWGWFWSLSPVQCFEPPSIILQALCLADLIPWIYLSLPLYNHKWFVSVIPESPSGFPYFLQFMYKFCIRSPWSEPWSAPSFVFEDWIDLFHLWLWTV